MEDGEYLLRVEHLALHQAKSNPEFYLSCAQVEVTGGGAGPASGADPDNLVAFPGAYHADDPGILIDIYQTAGVPEPNPAPYQHPGPAPITC